MPNSSPAGCPDSVHYPWTTVVKDFEAGVVTLQPSRRVTANSAIVDAQQRQFSALMSQVM